MEMRNHLLIFFFLSIAVPATGKILIATVAQVKNHVITSREVSIHKELDQVLGKKFEDFTDGNSTEEVIREWLLYFEAISFYNNKITDSRLSESLQRAQTRLVKSSGWKKLGVTGQELKNKIRRRMEADRIYTFKKKASVLPVSLSEIETEYTQNRMGYGNESFDEAKEKIRKKKTDQNMKTRMGQWFNVLERKYKVQRFSKFSELNL